MNCAEGGGIDPREVELGGLLLKERAELVNFVVGLLQRGVQSCEIGPALQEYIAAKLWPPQGLQARFGIMQSAREMVRKAAEEVAEKKANEPAALQVVSLSEMDDQAVRWLWPGRIPLGKVTVICGESGLGKTCLLLDLAARVSAGSGWPDGASGPETGGPGVDSRQTVRLESLTYGPGKVLLLNGEDHWGESIRPRLAGGGAIFENITAIAGMNSGMKVGTTGARCFELERDLPVLKQQIETLGEVRLVIIDSLEANCESVVGQSRLRMRKLVAALAKLADECGVAVVVVSSGSKCDLPVKHVWKVDCDVLDPELRLWIPMKFNSGRLPQALGYRVTDKGIAWEERPLSPRSDWLRGSTAKQERSWRVMQIAAWLKEYLSQGPCASQEVLEAGGAFGWTASQVKRAKLVLDIACHKDTGKNGRWIWQLN